MNYFHIFVIVHLVVIENSLAASRKLSSKRAVSETNYECWSGLFPPAISNQSQSIETFKINLDLPPKYRHFEIIDKKGEALRNLIKTVRSEVIPFWGGRLLRILEDLGVTVAKRWPSALQEEMEGIALGSSVSVADIALINIFYELHALCTSIVARSKTGDLIHGRNLDFGLFLGWNKRNHSWIVPNLLRPLTVQLDFQRNNKTIFSSVSMAGMIGVVTGVRLGAYSLTINERFSLRPGLWYIIRWLFGAQSLQWNSVITRRIMENTPTYHAARDQLVSTPLIAPVYFTLASGDGSGEAVVITRDQYTGNVWPLGTPSVTQSSTWYLLQTNYDHNRNPPFYDNRRTVGVDCMDKFGSSSDKSDGGCQCGTPGRHRRSIEFSQISGNDLAPTSVNSGFLNSHLKKCQCYATEESVYSVLHTKPLLNLLTVHSSLMIPANGSIRSWLEKCEGANCQLW